MQIVECCMPPQNMSFKIYIVNPTACGLFVKSDIWKENQRQILLWELITFIFKLYKYFNVLDIALRHIIWFTYNIGCESFLLSWNISLRKFVQVPFMKSSLRSLAFNINLLKHIWYLSAYKIIYTIWNTYLCININIVHVYTF